MSREVPAAMTERWKAQAKIGDQKPTVRATIQIQNLKKFDYDTAWAQGGSFEVDRHRTGYYTSMIFGDSSGVREIPNIKSYTWTRSVNQDVATCTLTILNAELTAIGEVDPNIEELDQPGFFTWNRGTLGEGISADRWGYDTETGWNGIFVPDRLVKTYEGYGSNPDVVPALDENLLQSGAWLIDEVSINSDGDMVLTMRDLGRMLLDQIVFPPVVPYSEYPLVWSKTHTENVPGRDVTGGAWDSDLRGRGTATSSNTYYIGQGLTDPPYAAYVTSNGGWNGHHPVHALRDGDDNYWSSTGQTTRNSTVWWQLNLNSATPISGVRLHMHGGPYRAYISIHNGTKWVGTKTIPYTVTTEGIDIDANVKYVKSVIADRRTRFDVILPRVYKNATKLRITLTRLHDNWLGNYRWRGGIGSVGIYTGNADDLGFAPGEVLKVVGNYYDYCVDTETEIFTQRGWLRYDDVGVGDQTLAIDPNTGLSSWRTITDVYRKHRKRTMLSMESTVHSSLTTPDHRWLITDHAGRRDWRTTETLSHGHSLPLSATRADPPQEVKYTDALVELVAWFWTEGWTIRQGGCVNARLAQSRRVNPAYCERIEAALTTLTGPARQKVGREVNWSMQERADGVVTYHLGQALTREVVSHAPDKVPSVDFLQALTAAQLSLYIETSIDADGWRDAGGRRISQASEARTRSFEYACALAGIPTSTSVRKGIWYTNLLKHRQFRPALTKRTEVEYDGVIWCPVLDQDYNWLARRNGKVYFTGNTQIVKWVCAWGGFFWPPHSTGMDFFRTGQGDEKTYITYPYADNFVLVKGRVWGDLMASGTAGVADLTVDMFDKKPLMDVINYVRDLLGFVFWIDETGGVVWRMPNIWAFTGLGNYTSPGQLEGRSQVGFGTYNLQRKRTKEIVVLDEEETLLSYTTTLDSKSIRERIFVANNIGGYASVIKGFNPYPVGLRRMAGWSDQNFKTNEETRVMADMISARQMFTWKRGKATIPGYPKIQIDDQIRIFERVSNETYYHYVMGITSNLNMETGEWTYDLDTHWLGEDPEDAWVVDSEVLPTATKNYLNAIGYESGD